MEDQNGLLEQQLFALRAKLDSTEEQIELLKGDVQEKDKINS